ncbi:MAG: DUF484 family protein [Gammaproteobacteria bacterium]
MSDTSVTDEQVARFLRDNPGFFTRHADLLVDLHIPHASGNAVSLVERQVAVLRERNIELRERLDSLLSVARDNDVLFGKTRTLVLALLEAQTIAALSQALLRSLVEDFGMAASSLLLLDARTDATSPGVQVLSTADAEARVGGLARTSRVVCGVLRGEENAFFFGADADAVGSAAIIPLVLHGTLGLLAIGARDPKHFQSGMDTLFVGYLGEVIARRLHALLPGRDAPGRARTGA